MERLFCFYIFDYYFYFEIVLIIFFVVSIQSGSRDRQGVSSTITRPPELVSSTNSQRLEIGSAAIASQQAKFDSGIAIIQGFILLFVYVTLSIDKI